MQKSPYDLVDGDRCSVCDIALVKEGVALERPRNIFVIGASYISSHPIADDHELITTISNEAKLQELLEKLTRQSLAALRDRSHHCDVRDQLDVFAYGKVLPILFDLKRFEVSGLAETYAAAVEKNGDFAFILPDFLRDVAD
jgi:hypothetical protein